MNTLALSAREKLYSRLIIYGILLTGLGLTSHFSPPPPAVERLFWESVDPARAYIAVPIEEMEPILARLAR